MKYLNASIIVKLPTLWKVVGIIITFLFWSILVCLYLRVTDAIIRLWKVCKWIYLLPLMSVVIGFFKCVYSFCVSIPGKVEKEEKKEKDRQGKRANAILGLSSWLFKEFCERLAEPERKGILTNQEEEKEKKVEAECCPNGGRKGHKESMC